MYRDKLNSICSFFDLEEFLNFNEEKGAANKNYSVETNRDRFLVNIACSTTE